MSKRRAQDAWRFPALRVEQREDIPLFVFGADGRIVHQFASIDLAERSGAGELAGYQRSKVKTHIAQIRKYLESDGAFLPNALVVAFDSTVRFDPMAGVVRSRWGTPGKLRVPMHAKPKPGFIVDGQQRAAALSQIDPEERFPVIVVGFVAPSEEFQRDQFVLLNKTKPLPRDLINELLPHVESVVPPAWKLRKVSAAVLERLRFDSDSPFNGRIRGLGSAEVGANISQAAVLAVIEGSIRRKGVLAPFYDKETGEGDSAKMAMYVGVFYSGVARVWPTAWRGSPRRSRLVHGVGIYATGVLMDVVMADLDPELPGAIATVTKRVARIRRRCAWTSGRWPRLRREWNELQNTAQDKRVLADYVVRTYND